MFLIFSLFVLSLAAFSVRLNKAALIGLRRHSFLILSFAYLLALIVLIGPSVRFLVVFTPLLVLSVALLLVSAYQRLHDQRLRYVGLTILAVILTAELLYTTNSQLTHYPRGPETWAYSGIRSENFGWGYNELERYLQAEFKGKISDQQIEQKYTFLQNLQSDALSQADRKGYQRYSAIVIYDSNLHYAPQIWTLLRLRTYHAWPVVTTQEFLKLLKESESNNLTIPTFRNHYFIMPTAGKIRLRNPANITRFGVSFEQELQKRGVKYESLFNPRGDEIFKIYRF